MFLYKPKQHEGIGTGIFLINQGIGATKFMFIEMCAILFTKHMGQEMKNYIELNLKLEIQNFMMEQLQMNIDQAL